MTVDVATTRQAEWTLLARALQRANDGSACAAVIEGEAGIGKSWLLQRAREHVHAEHWLVLDVEADWFGQPVPYAALQRAVADSGLDVDGPCRDALVAALDVTGATPLNAVHSAATRYLDEISAEGRPIAVLVDDLHLVDSDTLALLWRLLRHVERRALVLVGAFRRGAQRENAALGALLERLEAVGALITVSLGPLSRDAVEAIITDATDVAPTPELVEEILVAGGGNPYLVGEVLAGCGDAGLDTTRRASVVQRILWMGGHAERVARACALLRRIDLERLPLIAELAGLSHADAGAAFDALVAHGSLVPSGSAEPTYVFAHAVLRDALAEDVGPAERRTASARIAAWIVDRQRPLDAEEIIERATCIAECAERGDHDSVAVLTAAAELSATSAPRTAIQWYRRALDLLDPGSHEEALARARLSRLLYIAAEPAEAAAEGVRAIAALPAGELRARTASFVGTALVSVGDVDAAIALVDSELEHGTRSPRLHALRAHLLARCGRLDEARIEEEIVLEMLRTSSHSDQAVALVSLTHALVVAGRWDDLRTIWEKQLALMPSLVPEQQLGIYLNRAFHLTLSGDAQNETAALRDAAEMAARVGPELLRPDLVLATAWHDLHVGEWDDLLATVEAASEQMVEASELICLSSVTSLAIEVHGHRGEWASGRRLARRPVHPFVRHLHACAVSGLELLVGDLDAALATTTRSLADDCAAADVQVNLLARLVEVHIARGDDVAARAAARVLSGGRPLGAAMPLARLAQGVAFRDGDLLLDVLADLRSRRRPFWLARAHLHLGELGVGDAGDHLTTAHRAFNELGAVPWRRRSAAALRAGGHPIPRLRAPRPATLTETEAQIAALVGDGRRNREIAATVSMSVKTVEQHLTRIYAKLGVSSRLALARLVDAGALESAP